MTDKDAGVYGICLRGKPGWGDNMAFLTTMANSCGARWFDKELHPQLDSAAWNHAVSMYVDHLKKLRPSGLQLQQRQRDSGAVRRRQVRCLDRRNDRGIVRIMLISPYFIMPTVNALI